MAARPLKRQKRPIVLSSSPERQSTSDTEQGSLDADPVRDFHPVAPELLVLPSRTRSKQKRAKPPVVRPLEGSDRSKHKVVKERSIHTFFTASITQQRSTQESDEVGVEELDDLIQDGITHDETTASQNAQSKKTAAEARGGRDGPASRNGRSWRGNSVPSGSQKFVQSYKTTTQPTKSASSFPPSDTHKDFRPWTDKYPPGALDELAVHKKKVEDVRKWLEGFLDGRNRQKVLILKGPSGTGKTTTVSLLSKMMNVEILEWQNPVSPERSAGYTSILAQFDDFINYAGRFDSLELFADFEEKESVPAERSSRSSLSQRKKLMLVEEFPNIFMRSSAPVQQFRTTIQQFLARDDSPPCRDPSMANKYVQRVTPLVLIISETLLATSSSADSFTAHRLLGPEILSHPGVNLVEFNPVARTLLGKALELVLRKDARESGKLKSPGPSVLERLGQVGDIRNALASLEFLCLRQANGHNGSGKSALVKSRTTARKVDPLSKADEESLQAVTQREASLGLFHAVGKVVYNKRDDIADSDLSLQPLAQPPCYLSQHARRTRSQVAVDELIDQTGTDTPTFVSTLHENYILSCYGVSSGESLETVNSCIDYLSDSDLLSPSSSGTSSYSGYGGRFRRNISNATGKDTLRQDEICFHIAVRGVLFSLPFSVKRRPPPVSERGGSHKVRLASTKGDAFKMFYPASMRLWRRREEIEAVVDLCIKHLSQGTLMRSADELRPSRGVVESWANRFAAVSGGMIKDEKSLDSVSDVVPCSGLSGRSQMVLERLPYTAKIVQSKTSPLTPIPDTYRVTVFNGIDLDHDEGSEYDDDIESEPTPGTGKTSLGMLTDNVTQLASETGKPQVQRRKADSHEIPLQLDNKTEKLFLSDDDIEDD